MKSGKTFTDDGSALQMAITVALAAAVVLIVAAVLFPMFARTSCGSPKSSCQNNMKELGTALAMYHGDYDGKLPSSFLYGRSKTWNRSDFIAFASKQGTLPPPEHVRAGATWAMLLYPYMKNKDIMWCTSDPDSRNSGNVSYFYKAAADRAWYGDGQNKMQKEGDFDFPADQVIFYEKTSWHWRDESKGLSDGVTLNMTFMDGHVQAKSIRNSGGSAVTPTPMRGEPAWYNYSGGDEKPGFVTGQCWDPHTYHDNLP